VHMIGPGVGTADLGISLEEMASLGFRLIIDAVNPLVSIHDALLSCYASIARGIADLGVENPRANYQAIMNTVGLERLLEIERRTVEK